MKNLDELINAETEMYRILCYNKEKILKVYTKFYPNLEYDMMSTKLLLFNSYMFDSIKAYDKYYRYLDETIDLLRHI